MNEAAGGGADRVFASASYTLKAGQEIEALSTTNNGGTGAINLTGNELANSIFGNAGNNIINGGLGNDVLTGLGGHDAFRFNTALNTSTNVDHISDFTTHSGAAAETDTIELAHAVFAALATGALTASAFFSGAGATAAHDADDHIIYNATTGALYYDSDGAGGSGAVEFAALTAHPVGVSNADFQVV